MGVDPRPVGVDTGDGMGHMAGGWSLGECVSEARVCSGSSVGVRIGG